MKKFFSLVLAVAMIASMAATAFAYDFNVTDGIATKAKGFTIDDKGPFYPVVNAIGPLGYDNDDKALTGKPIEYGKTAYYALLQSESITTIFNPALVTKAEVVSGLKIKTKWEEGSKLIKSVSVVKKKVTNNVTTLLGETYPSVTALLGENYGYVKDNYYYFIAIAAEASTTTSDSDIIGTLTLSKTKAPKIDELVMDISMNIDWANSYRKNTDLDVKDDIDDLKSETNYALKFSSDEEIAIGFSDESIFTVDVSGQSKLLVYYDTKFNSKVAAKYPLAELNFWNGNGAKFNRVGEMFIPVKEDFAQFIYQLNEDGSLSEVSGAEYDKYDGGFYFYTRVLGSYVISDMELDIKPAVVTPPADTTTPVVSTPVVNPSTGAAA